MTDLTHARLQELRAEHQPQRCLVESCECVRCIKVQCNHEHVWPCEQSEILDLALEAERLREALWHHHKDTGLETDPEHCRSCQDGLAGTEAKDG